MGLIGDYVWVCDLWGMWVGLVVEEEGGWFLVVAARMVGCGGYDGGLWIVGFWLWRLGWLVMAIYIGF